ALQHALPKALILLSEDLEQAKRQAKLIRDARPQLVLAGGGDGSIVRLLNLLRDAGPGPLPTVGLLKLGTGNGWARAMGARGYFETVKQLPRMPMPPPVKTFPLLEVEETLCHFAGVGWDARILNDYLRNLDRRSAQLVGSRLSTKLHKGLAGYMYSLFRITIPEELILLLKSGQPRVTLTTDDDEVSTLDASGRPIPLRGFEGAGGRRVLFEGQVSVGAAATTPEWGFGFRAFPFAGAVPGRINVRVYDRPVLEATLNMPKLWRGAHPQPGMHDWFVKTATMRFSRPMPFQIGGDGLGTREEVSYRIADETVDVVDWNKAREMVDAERLVNRLLR
ncbi:MAG: diacylglycerol/lipid kinase family protein, partial [Myxococcales bacterium]